ncbi:MAG: PRC-barrel domain-containing protein [Hyphomicrobiales bacterium]|nr:PRC-barrel domain-containing protein [Hyphomicrobiales bacterium]
MAHATIHANSGLISSADVHGAAVYGADRERIGQIDRLMIDALSGKISYAVVSFGGFLGFGHSHYPVPWPALKYDAEFEGYITGVTEQQLRDAPEFSDDGWLNRESEQQGYSYYGADPYWT